MRGSFHEACSFLVGLDLNLLLHLSSLEITKEIEPNWFVLLEILMEMMSNFPVFKVMFKLESRDRRCRGFGLLWDSDHLHDVLGLPVVLLDLQIQEVIL